MYYILCVSVGYPNEEAATVAVETVMEWLEKNGDEVHIKIMQEFLICCFIKVWKVVLNTFLILQVDRIIFCVFLEDDNYVYHQLMLKYFPCTVASDDDDQDDGSKDKASAKERSKTEHKKGESQKLW